MSERIEKSEEQKLAEAEVESFRKELGPFVVAAETTRMATQKRVAGAMWPPVPDLFDVITYFRARGDSFVLISSIGFRVGEERKKALSARGLEVSYEGELDRRAAAKAAIR